MSKARTLADFISDGSEFADGTISVAEVSGAAPLASPSFTGNATLYNASASANLRIETDADAYSSISFLNDQSNWGVGVDNADHFYVYDSINASNIMEFGNNDIVFNQTGKDYDFRVESDGNTHMLFVDASENAVAIGSASTSTASRLRASTSAVSSGNSIVLIDSANDANVAGNHLRISSARGDTSAYNLLTIDNVAGEILNISGNGSVVFNEAGGDRDFRIESDITNYSFFVDASESGGYGRVKISAKTPASATSTSGGDATTYINGLTIENNEASYTNGGLALVNKYNWGYGNSIAWSNIYDAPSGTLGVTNRIVSQWVSANNYKTDFFEMSGGVLRKSLSLNAGQVVVNEDGQDEDFRVESDANANMIFVDSSTNKVGVGYGSPDATLSVNGPSLATTSGSGVLGFNTRVPDGNISSLRILNYRYATGADHTTAEMRLQKRVDSTDFGYIGFQSTDHAVNVGTGYGRKLATFAGSSAVFNQDGYDVDFRVESDSNANAIFVDAQNDRRGFGTGAPEDEVHIRFDRNNSNLVDTVGNNSNAAGGLKIENLNSTANSYAGLFLRSYSGDIKMMSKYAGTANQANLEILQDRGSGIGNMLEIGQTTTVFNEDSKDQNFRVESNANANALLVDAGNETVNIGTADFNVADNSGSDRGINFLVGGQIRAAAYQQSVLLLNRLNNDGQVVSIRQNGTEEGSISVSSNTVSYNGFAGRHESSGIPTTTAKGTVVSTIDELDVFLSGNSQGQTRANHAKVEVSNTVGDSCVYGVVDDFTDDGSVNVVSVGIGAVRVTGSCAKGDLLESNGDGTAKVQSDDIIRSKTIGKVTIGNSDTGVKLVSCVMYCG